MSMPIHKNTIKCNFSMDKNNADKAHHSLLKALSNKKELCRTTKEEIESIGSFVRLMEVCSWSPLKDKSGNISSLEYIGVNVAEEDLLFESLAPFVNKGSTIEYVRDTDVDNRKILFEFNGESVKKTAWSKQYDMNNKEYWELLDLEYSE